ncbi:acid protease [Trametes cingulata]|nr:acid protease [Trametes cingulata]
MMFSHFSPLVGIALSFVIFARPATCAVAPRIPSAVRGGVGGVQVRQNQNDPVSASVDTSDNESYITKIVLGGLELTVVLDTGSSDLVVNLGGRQPNLSGESTIQATDTYGSGSPATGNLLTADLQIGGVTISSQTFLNASSVPTSFDGIMGMSFAGDISGIEAAITKFESQFPGQNVALDANPPMLNLLAQQPNLPDNFDVQLARSDGFSVASGTFLIGEHDQNVQQALANAPQLPVLNDLHWDVVMDAMLINGQPFAFDPSGVQGVPSGKLVASLDTGASFALMPAAAVNAIYSNIPGAAFDQKSNGWLVPCDATASVSFVFGGQEYPVHPLDLSLPSGTQVTDANGQKATVCLAGIAPLTLDPNVFQGFDVILGDTFLRNVYASFNYGTRNGNNFNAPFVQMVSTTPDLNQANQEFQTQRAAQLAKLPPTIDPSAAVQGGSDQAPATSAPSGSPTTQTQSGTEAKPTGSTQGTTTAAPSAKPSNGSAKSGSWSGCGVMAVALALALVVL